MHGTHASRRYQSCVVWHIRILCTAVAVTCSHLFYIIHLSVYHVQHLRTFVQVNIVGDFIQLLKFLNTPLDKMYVM